MQPTVGSIIPWEGPGLCKKAEHEPMCEPAHSNKHGFCFRFLLEILLCLPSKMDFAWKCEPNKPSPPLSCFWFEDFITAGEMKPKQGQPVAKETFYKALTFYTY